MKTTELNNPAIRKIVLVASGLLAIGIASTILVSPNAFYAAYGIELAGNTSLINELKAPAGLLFLAGLLMFAGALRAELTVAALITAAAIYLAYGLSRVSSIVVDGVPDSSLVSAAGAEIFVGAICAFMLLPELKNRQRRTTN